MNAECRWDDDPKLNEIVSPLASNAKLHSLIADYHDRRRELDAAECDEKSSDQHFAEVDRVAGYLVHRDHCGGFGRWDWAAQFLTDEGFRRLYDEDKHWMFDFMKADASEFLADQNREMRARTGTTKQELESLLAIISHFEAAEWRTQILRIQRLIAE
jgi:hypothetical protein